MSTVNMLTTVLNDSPIFPENEEEQADLSAPLLMDSPQVRVPTLFFSTFYHVQRFGIKKVKIFYIVAHAIVTFDIGSLKNNDDRDRKPSHLTLDIPFVFFKKMPFNDMEEIRELGFYKFLL